MRFGAGVVLTFTSSHIALSSVRTRVVWSGVEGTTMDFCRGKMDTRGRELDGCRNRQPAQKVDMGRPYVDPGVVHELCDGHSLIGVCLQQQADQVFG